MDPDREIFISLFISFKLSSTFYWNMDDYDFKVIISCFLTSIRSLVFNLFEEPASNAALALMDYLFIYL